MLWQWKVPPIVLGEGSSEKELLEFLATTGKRWAVVCGGHWYRESWNHWRKLAENKGLQLASFIVSGGEPTVPMVDGIAYEVRLFDPDGIVGIGGGSVLDVAKALAAMVKHEGSVADYLEEVGTKKLSSSVLPWVGVPTTAGTGSEVTKNAVIIVPEKRVKRSLRHESLFASAVFLDPLLTLSQPWEVTVNAALDAFTHLLEAAVSRRSHPWAFALADGTLSGIVSALERVRENSSDREARQELLVASTAGGMALANAGLGAVHGFAATLGGLCSIPHGRVCGILLDHVVEVNSRFTSVYDKLQMVREHGGVDGFVRFLREWKQMLGVERDFRRWQFSFVPEEIVRMSTSSSMKANPVDVPFEDWVALWRNIL